MPFYEYECPKCKFYTEVLQKLSDKPLKKCPSCGKAGFRRLVSAPVFRLKGSGWYETDFKSDKEGQRNLAGAERDEPAAPVPDAKAKGDGQAAAKPAADAPAARADKDKPGADRAPSGKSARGTKQVAKSTAKPAARPAAKSAARRGAKRPASAAKRRSVRR
jgi:putative FmdB family regulatory protein